MTMTPLKRACQWDCPGNEGDSEEQLDPLGNQTWQNLGSWRLREQLRHIETTSQEGPAQEAF